ncbi:MAG TPA: NUDIX hydrolase [Candidatus Acidoferrales bacterium]|nr:NUDIX hydrolase [Candidatus Acidoferrales bacterium]
MAKPKAKVVSSKMIYQGKVFGVRQDRVVEPGGVDALRDVVTHNGSVVILPVLSGRILLVRQYRHTVGDFLWELPAGRMERGEKPAVAANRELEEETGYRAKHLKMMMDVYPTPGFVEERMVVYAATGLVPGESHPDDDERISTKPFKLATLLRMIRQHQIHDAKSVAGILFYARFLHSSR